MSHKRINRCQRPIAQRIIVRGTLILDTPTCLGSGDADSPTDLALLRDSVSDCGLLIGSSIAGALRNYLREYQHGYGIDEQKGDRATCLFGGTRRDPDGEQSPLIINDAISSTIPIVELRDGVEIEAITGTAKPGHKYDLELLAAGTEFPLSFELVIEKNKNQTEQQALINDLALALRGLEQHEIGIGMKKRRGVGIRRDPDIVQHEVETGCRGRLVAEGEGGGGAVGDEGETLRQPADRTATQSENVDRL